MAQFTKTAIIESFLRLLETRSIEKITVKDIVEDCGVNRKTLSLIHISEPTRP